MAVLNAWYLEAFLAAFDKEIDYLADNIACTLHAVGYVPNQDTDDYRDDATSELSTANGYTAGGQNLGTKTNTKTGATNVIAFTAADVSWTATGTLTARLAVISDITPGTAGTNPMMSYHLSDANISATDAAFTVDFPAAGFASITVGAPA